MTAVNWEANNGHVDHFVTLDGHETMNLTSFDTSGRGVTTPTWFVKLSGKVYLVTDPDSYKVKRIRQTGRVEVGPSTLRGKPLGPTTQAQARILDPVSEQPQIASVYRAMRSKLGLMLRLFDWVGKLRGRRYIDAVVEIAHRSN